VGLVSWGFGCGDVHFLGVYFWHRCSGTMVFNHFVYHISFAISLFVSVLCDGDNATAAKAAVPWPLTPAPATVMTGDDLVIAVQFTTNM